MIEKMKQSVADMNIVYASRKNVTNLVCPKCGKGNIVEIDKIFKCSEMKWIQKLKIKVVNLLFFKRINI